MSKFTITETTGDNSIHQIQHTFAFEIGDFVKLKAYQNTSAIKPSDKFWSASRSFVEFRGQVLERLVQQCIGGIQIWYQIRWCTSNGAHSDAIEKHNEIELVKSEPFPCHESEAADG